MAQRFEESVLEVLRELGTGALSNPRTFVGLVVDVYGPDEPESIVLAYHCDRQFMSHFTEAISSRTPEALSLAASRAEMLLIDERFVAPQRASSVAYGISRALATHFGVAMPSPGSARSADEASRREEEAAAKAKAEAARKRAEAEAARKRAEAELARREEAEAARRAAEEERRRHKRKLSAACSVLLALVFAAGAVFPEATIRIAFVQGAVFPEATITTAFAQVMALLAVLSALCAVGLLSRKPAVVQVLAALACVGCAVYFWGSMTVFAVVLVVAALGYVVSAVSIWKGSRRIFVWGMLLMALPFAALSASFWESSRFVALTMGLGALMYVDIAASSSLKSDKYRSASMSGIGGIMAVSVALCMAIHYLFL